MIKYENVHFVDTLKNVWNYSLFTDDVIRLFQNGLLTKAQDFFGAKKITAVNTDGFYFSIWAPNAKIVSVVGDFNEWDRPDNPEAMSNEWLMDYYTKNDLYNNPSATVGYGRVRATRF